MDVKKIANYRDDEVSESDPENSSYQEGSFAPFQACAIEIKEHAEVRDLKKKARVIEEISIDKQLRSTMRK